MFRNARIETARTRLRPFTMADLAVFREIAGQEEVLEFLPDDRMTPAEAKGLLQWLIACYDEDTLERLVKFSLPIALRETGEVVGWVGLGPLDFDVAAIEIYFVISRAHWGKGYATEAARALLGYGFTVLGLPRVVGVVDRRNGASVRVLEKAGLRYERTVEGLPDAYRSYEGHLLYALTADEWTRRRLGSER